MEIPKDSQINETNLFWLWLDKDGILCSKYKKNVVVTKESMQESYLVINNMLNNEKVCLLSDIRNRVETSKEVRDYSLMENSKFVTAQALLFTSASSKYIAEIFVSLNKTPYPIQIFNDENVAKEWLKTHLLHL